MTCHFQRCVCAVLALLAVVLRAPAGATTCSSGVLQMHPYPVSDGTNYDCFPKTAPFVSVTQNSIKPLCNVAARVAVSASGVVKLTPVPVASYTYSGYYLAENIVMNCQDHNASGLFNAGSTTAATLMMYDNLGGPLTNLTKTGPHQITLSPGHFEYERSPTESCSYNYTVVSGCVLGATPPAKPLACAAGYIVKKGRFNIKYCSPCPPRTSSPGPNSASCKPCPAGTSNQNYGGRCTRCEQGSYAPKAASAVCKECPRGYTSTRAGGAKCERCPAGSYPSLNQCYKCYAGKKCCTVNWTSATGGCPKCPAGAPSGATSTSTFALHTASRPLCLATAYALCAPRITVKLDDSCRITLLSDPPPGSLRSCAWQLTVPIQGAKVDPKVDFAKVGRGNSNVIVAGNTTLAPPYMTFYTPKNKCTFQYRALTKPAASLLGVAPKPCPLGTPGCPTASSTCPAGHHRDLTTDTPPGPCLPCPPGTYSPKASSAAACKPCAAGTYASSYSSTGCEKCPAATVSTAGAPSCKACSSNTIPATASTCKRCPAHSGYGDGLGGLASCLANAYGNVCCAAGNCTGQTPCSGALPTRNDVKQDWYPAVLQLVSKSLPQPACKNAAFLACLQDKGLLRLRAHTVSENLAFFIEPIMQPKCGGPSPGSTRIVLSGIYTSSNRGYLTPASGAATEAYDLLSSKSLGTLTASLTAYVPNEELAATPPPPTKTTCSATFKLVAGYAFDLAPPAGASCPANAAPLVLHNRTFCAFCDEGGYKKASTGSCETCPAGTYQDTVGSTSCKKCAAGFLCPYASTTQPGTCPRGQYVSQPSGGQCTKCPANTFVGSPATLRCTPCPKGTIAPAGSMACGVPWDK